ncbi:TPA: VENN motif pre-toxin domain-containing protein [Providencia rettgeri]|nr:VENN motif pre-toxin domain-containing protein [Providencia rettgeri]HEM6890162.1 VENN motif pre-toxin domain-containing protein [Providencia rettgeri]
MLRRLIHSNYDSVKEQTGIFAGKGGFDVNVKEHTQLDGAVIASTADKDKNRLETGTLGWKDIDNKADFTAEHTGGSIGTGGPIGSQLVTNAAGGLLSNANNSGHAEGTTQSAVSDGTVIVRNEDKQKQDVNELNRDTEHANDGSINPIFDKEKEQNRLKQSQLIGEIGNQTMDIIRTEGDIAGLKAQKDPDALAIAKKPLEAAGKTPTEQAIKEQAYNNAMAQYGTGSDFQKAAQAVTGLLQGLAGDNLAGALANASSPYLATKIKELTTDPATGEVNKATNAMAHAVLGAVVAELNNQSAAAGGLGAGGGELSAHVILNTLFPGKKVSDLTESEKQQVSALSQLASGLAGGLTTGDVASAITGSQAAKNAVENNSMALGGNLGFLFADIPDCDASCKADITKGINNGNLVVSGASMGIVAAGYSSVIAPEMIATVRAALTGCKAAPVICLNEVGIFTAEVVTPGGTGAGGALIIGKTAQEVSTVKQVIQSEAKAGKINLNQLTSAESTVINSSKDILKLPNGKQGTVIQNALEPHEYQQALDIVKYKGGNFKGVEKKISKE